MKSFPRRQNPGPVSRYTARPEASRRAFFADMIKTASTPAHRAECRAEWVRLAGLIARLIQRRD